MCIFGEILLHLVLQVVFKYFFCIGNDFISLFLSCSFCVVYGPRGLIQIND